MKIRQLVIAGLLVLLAIGCEHQDSHGMEMEGMFRYMADAAVFRDCRNGKVYPVAGEGAYLELESAYLNSGITPGSEVFVKLQGRLLERQAMEGNNNIIKLIINNFDKLHIDKTCAPTVHADLTGTYWKLVELNGNRIDTPEGMKEAHMILETDQSRVRGNAGCNNFFGQYDASADGLTFSAMGSTMMACPHAMDTERDFLAALGAANRYEISGLFLELFAQDQPLARLEAIYP